MDPCWSSPYLVIMQGKWDSDQQWGPMVIMDELWAGGEALFTRPQYPSMVDPSLGTRSSSSHVVVVNGGPSMDQPLPLTTRGWDPNTFSSLVPLTVSEP